MINKEDVEKRINELEQERQEFFTKAQTQLNVYDGALAESRRLLVFLTTKETVDE